MTAAVELRTLLGCVCAGVVIGMIYDVLSVFRFPFHSAVIDGIFDALFYFAVLLISAAALFLFNNGVVRFYALAGIVGGAFLYMRFPSRIFRVLGRKILKIIHK